MDNSPDLSKIHGGPETSTGAKLTDEASLLAGGIAAGIWQRSQDIAEAPVQSALTVGGTAAVTGGLAWAASRFAPEMALTAGKLVLGTAVALEAARGASGVLSAVADTWHNPEGERAANKQAIADSLGKPLMNAAIFGVAGFGSVYVGSKVGAVGREIAGSLELQATRKTFGNHFPLLLDGPKPRIQQMRMGKDTQLGKIYQDNAPSVVQIFHDTGLGNGRGSYATGFVVDENLIATNNHVLHGHITPLIKSASGEMIEATLVARDKRADLALLKLPDGALKARPVDLGTSDSVSERSRLVMIGHPQNVSRPVLGDGFLITRQGQKFLLPTKGQLDQYPKHEMFAENVTVKGHTGVREVWRPDTPAHVIRRDVLSHNVPSQPGNSGSPIFDINGRVVAVHSIGGEHRWASSVGHLKALLSAYKEKPAATNWLNVITNARPRATELSYGQGFSFTRLHTEQVDILEARAVEGSHQFTTTKKTSAPGQSATAH